MSIDGLVRAMNARSHPGTSSIEQPDALVLAPSDIQLRPRHLVTARRALVQLVVDADEHEVVVVNCGRHKRHVQAADSFEELRREGGPALGPDAHDLVVSAAAPAIDQVREGLVLFQICGELLHVDVADSHAAGHVVVVGLAERSAGPRRKIAVPGAVHETARPHQLLPLVALREHARDGGALARRPRGECVQQRRDTGFCEQLVGHELVELGVDRRAHRIIVEPLLRLCVAAGAPDGVQPIDDLLGDALAPPAAAPRRGTPSRG